MFLRSHNIFEPDKKPIMIEISLIKIQFIIKFESISWVIFAYGI